MEVVPGARLRCVQRSAVRVAAHLHSDRVGFLEAGSEITALDVQASDALDAVRVRYLQGWVSTKSATGAVLLELVSLAPTLSSDIAPSAHTITGDSGSGGMEALDELTGTMRHMKSVLRDGSGFGSGADRAEAMERASRLLSEASYGAASEAFRALLARDPGDESAQRGLRQAEKGLRLMHRIELAEWFSGLGLQHFAQPIVEQGYESLCQLQKLSDVELHAVQDAVGMRGSEATTFSMALRGVPCAGKEHGLGGLLAAAPSVSSSAENLPRGLLSRSQTTSSSPIAHWIRAWDLADSVEHQLQELGVETVGDLQALDADDIANLRPLKKVQSKKFVQALAQALDDIEREMVENELNRAHEVRVCHPQRLPVCADCLAALNVLWLHAQEAGRLRREHAASLMGRAVALPTPSRGAATAQPAGEDTSDVECFETGGTLNTPPPVEPS